MTIEESFFRDTVKLMPENAMAYFQVPDLDEYSLSERLSDSENPSYKSLQLTEENRSFLLEKVTENMIYVMHRMNSGSMEKCCLKAMTVFRSVNLAGNSYYQRNSLISM